MSDERNPFLPEAPADGQHVWSDGPTDLGGNHRCKLCGAYAQEAGHVMPRRNLVAERDQAREERDNNAEIAIGLAERIHHELHDYGAYVRAMDELA